MRVNVVLSLCAVSAFGLAACNQSSSIANDKEKIEQVVQGVLSNTGGATLVDPIIMRQEYAVADWTQGEQGGRTLLHREHGSWKVMATGGEEIRDADALARAGLGQKEAKALANTVIAKERQVPEDRLAKLDRYAAAK